MQREKPLPVDISRRSSTDTGLPSGIVLKEREVADIEEANEGTSASEGTDAPTAGAAAAPSEDATAETTDTAASTGPSGRIEAIKLTGDINVPRGECTWFADEIGDEGLVRIASEQPFAGARIVRCMAQVADQGFRAPRYIESQLILVSHNTLAQYWEVSRSAREGKSPRHGSLADL